MALRRPGRPRLLMLLVPFIGSPGRGHDHGTGLRSAEVVPDEAVQDDEPPFALPTLRVVLPDASPASHRSLGVAMGTRFAEGTRARLEEWADLQQHLLPALQTKAGQELYQGFLDVHTSRFPEFVEELRGVAQGSGVPFEWLFLAQIEQEFAAQLPGKVQGSLAPGRLRVGADHCSDYMFCSPKRCVDGHNEDNNANSINRTFILDAQLGGPETRFLAFVYMGELPSGAFGVNARGIGFSLNWVGPPAARKPGLGRGFVSRSLLDARSTDDAIARATESGQAGGHNIQLLDFCKRSILNIEVAQELFALRPIGEAPFFHANQYQTLNVPGQTFGNSSVHRLARVSHLPVPTSLEEVLGILGDQGDQLYPVFHDRISHARGELSDWTLATVAFDLDARRASVLQGNPKAANSRLSWDVSALVAAGGGCSGSGLLIAS